MRAALAGHPKGMIPALQVIAPSAHSCRAALLWRVFYSVIINVGVRLKEAAPTPDRGDATGMSPNAPLGFSGIVQSWTPAAFPGSVTPGKASKIAGAA
jgi:hypothetical protein